jgi:hypothetical protein
MIPLLLALEMAADPSSPSSPSSPLPPFLTP